MNALADPSMNALADRVADRVAVAGDRVVETLVRLNS